MRLSAAGVSIARCVPSRHPSRRAQASRPRSRLFRLRYCLPSDDTLPPRNTPSQGTWGRSCRAVPARVVNLHPRLRSGCPEPVEGRRRGEISHDEEIALHEIWNSGDYLVVWTNTRSCLVLMKYGPVLVGRRRRQAVRKPCTLVARIPAATPFALLSRISPRT